MILANAGDESTISCSLSDCVPGAYFNRCRHDVLELVPHVARRILSVGCGAGVTEGELVKRGASVTGIELHPPSAAAARQRGIDVLEGDAGKIDGLLLDKHFDCVVYADVLEHLTDPVGVLRTHVNRLTQGGVVIVSVPNFRHYEVLRALVLKGHIKYADAGILDRTHLRITTRKMVEEWMKDVGLMVTSVTYRMSRRREKMINRLSLHTLREFVARQVIVVGSKN